MSLKIYLDDCAYAKKLVALLRAVSHQVMTPAEAGLSGKADVVHLRYAATHGMVLVTRDVDDFEALHQADPGHHGILGICHDNDPTRDMSYAEIVKAIANLEQASIPIVGQFHVLNAWRY